jgi:hypothetical protein
LVNNKPNSENYCRYILSNKKGMNRPKTSHATVPLKKKTQKMNSLTRRKGCRRENAAVPQMQTQGFCCFFKAKDGPTIEIKLRIPCSESAYNSTYKIT